MEGGAQSSSAGQRRDPVKAQARRRRRVAATRKTYTGRKPRSRRDLPLAEQLEEYDLPRLAALAEKQLGRNKRRLGIRPVNEENGQ